VATRRKRPVLYEIVRHTRRTSDVGWRKSHFRTESPKRVPLEPLRASSAPGLRPAAVAVEAPRPLAAPESSAPVSTARSIHFAAGRLLIDLAWPGITATALLAIVLLALAFQAGKRYVKPAESVPAAQKVAAVNPADPAAPVRRESAPISAAVPSHRPPEKAQTPTVPARAAEPPPAPAPAAEPADDQTNQPAYAFKPNYHYVVVQYFPLEHKEVASDAVRFLQANGVDAVIVPKKSDVEVIATQPFLLKQKDRNAQIAAQKACDALKERIRTLGREFAKQQAAAKKPQYALDQPTERLRTK
jgi:hypothetical protein